MDVRVQAGVSESGSASAVMIMGGSGRVGERKGVGGSKGVGFIVAARASMGFSPAFLSVFRSLMSGRRFV